jgi:Carboxypeptidase regulatory-like domain
MNTMKCRFVLFVAAALLGTEFASSQELRATLSGRISDSSSSSIPAASVAARNTETNVTATTKANENGEFLLPYLIAGSYEITAEAPGFKKLVRRNIELRVSERVALDLQLEIGDVKDTVTVEATAPLLESSSANFGQVIDRRRVAELPLADGNPFALARLAAGMAVFGTGFTGAGTQPFSTTDPSSMVTNGGAGGNEFTLDGAPNTVDKRPDTGNRIGQQPPADAVQEFKVTTASFDAQQGHTAGATVDVAVRSGTNRLSGTVYEFVRNEVLSANNFFTNRSAPLGIDENGKAKRSPRRYNRFGATVGGPVFLPKLYNGKDKTFFFFSYEGIRTKTPKSETISVPSAPTRSGNFASLLPLGIRIYDPLTARTEGSRVVRSPFTGNIIPQGRISNVAQSFLKYFPEPNLPGDSQGRNNFASVYASDNVYDWFLGRFDHTLTENQRLFFRYSRGKRTEDDENRTGVTNGIRATGFGETRVTNNAIYDHVYTMSPSSILNFRVSAARFWNPGLSLSDGFLDPASLGFSQKTVSQFGDRAGLPRMEIPNFIELGGRSADMVSHDIYSFQPNLTKIAGSHTLRMGYDLRIYRENVNPPTDVAGRYRFRTDYTRESDLSSTAAPVGQEMAAFLLGIPSSSSNIVRQATRSNQNIYHGLYFQDDWKASRRLTLNLGVRYEYEHPTTERYNRNVRLFDRAVANPIEPGARAAYARSPIPEIPASDFRAPGGLLFAGENARGMYDPDGNNIQARIGAAFQLNTKTVLRGGYGMYAAPLTIDGFNQSGFDYTTPVVPSNDNGLTLSASFADPWPTGVTEPTGSSRGLATFVGQQLGGGVDYVTPTINRRILPMTVEPRKNPMIHRTEVSLQHELGGRWLIDAAYIGSFGHDLQYYDELNPTPRQYLSTSAIRDNATVSLLEANFSNPFRGLPEAAGSSLSTASVVQRRQLLRPFPEYLDIASIRHGGKSSYHSGQLRVERRFSKGLTVNGSYVYSKHLEQINKLNTVDTVLEKRVAGAHTPHRATFSSIYELPFGQGRKWLSQSNGAVRGILGGWQVGAIYVYQRGVPITLGNVFFNGNPGTLNLNYSGPTVDNVLGIDKTTSGFYLTDSSMMTNGQLDINKQIRDPRINLMYNVRTLSSRMPNLTGDSVSNFDFSLIKNTAITERMNLQFRAEVLNATNHVFFGALDFNPRNASFGRVTEQVNLPREWQIGLKLIF